MDYSQLVDSLTPEMVERFTEAVATGKWPDGQTLSEEQRNSCMQALMLYQARFVDSDEPFTISKDGELQTGKKIRADYADAKKQQAQIDPNLLITKDKV